MRIVCRLFARYAEAVGTDSVELELTRGATVADAIEALRSSKPGGSKIPAGTMATINLRHALPTQPLEEGDELALLPPVAGG